MTMPLLAGSIWIILTEARGSTSYFMGWLGSCFFGLGIFVGLFQTLDRRPQIIINENGIWDRSTDENELNWDMIKGAYILVVHNQKFVSLIIDDSYEFKKNQYMWASKLNEELGGQRINLLLNQLKIDANTMTLFINEMITSDKSDRTKIIDKYFEP